MPVRRHLGGANFFRSTLLALQESAHLAGTSDSVPSLLLLVARSDNHEDWQSGVRPSWHSVPQKNLREIVLFSFFSKVSGRPFMVCVLVVSYQNTHHSLTHISRPYSSKYCLTSDEFAPAGRRNSDRERGCGPNDLRVASTMSRTTRMMGAGGGWVGEKLGSVEPVSLAAQGTGWLARSIHRSIDGWRQLTD